MVTAVFGAYSASQKDTTMAIVYFWVSAMGLLPGIYVLFHLNMVPQKTNLTDQLPYHNTMSSHLVAGHSLDNSVL